VPERIQRKRTKGWRMPPGAVYVGRPSRWGNIYVVGEGEIKWIGCSLGPRVGRFDPKDVRYCDDLIPGRGGLTAAEAVALYRRDLLYGLEDSAEDLLTGLTELYGKDLCCWCALDAPCHADVLLEIANR
jgi:Domain of unknown function (DUF4326)